MRDARNEVVNCILGCIIFSRQGRPDRQAGLGLDSIEYLHDAPRYSSVTFSAIGRSCSGCSAMWAWITPSSSTSTDAGIAPSYPLRG